MMFQTVVSVRWSFVVFLCLLLGRGLSLTPPPPSAAGRHLSHHPHTTRLFAFQQKEDEDLVDDGMEEKFGGYTAKQRLREEVESPFRQVRLFFFASSVGSALTALYFSALSTLKAMMGGFSDAPPLEEALQSDAINIGAVIICGVLAYREYQVGQKNLERIAKGGKIARLVVEPASGDQRRTLADYRRAARVLIAVGGENYVSTMTRSLCSDQLANANNIPERLAGTDLVVVPVLLNKGSMSIGDARAFWNTVEGGPDDRDFDTDRAKEVVAFPRGFGLWEEFLNSEIETAQGQGFDVLEKGITLIIKKNGRILRRTTGQPQWSELIGAMEVMDGSKFGMPGDSEKYGGP